MNLFPAVLRSCYQGDAIGSFNSCMRQLDRVLFGMGLVGLACPRVNDSFANIGRGGEARRMLGLGG